MMNLSKAEYAKKAVSRIRDCNLNFAAPTFNEFVLVIKKEPGEVLERMKKEEILGGIPLVKFFPKLDHHLLVTVTEMNSKEEIDRWANVLERAVK